MKKLIAMTASALMSLTLLAQDANPFFREWSTPFQVPPFEQISNSHFMPAFEEGMRQQKEEILTITVNRAVPTFENTVLAFDSSGALLQKVSMVFYGLNSANTNPEMQDIAKKLSPLTTQHNDDIWLNPELFMKVKSVYEQRESLSLDADQKKLVEETYKNFVRGGANLPPESQVRLRELNKEINLLQITFGQNLLAETNSFKMVLDKKEELSGLPEGLLAAAAAAGNADERTKGKYVFTLQNPSVMPFLQFADTRYLREKIFNGYISRCNNNNDKDNKVIIAKLIPLRLEKAKLMGYETYADFVLEDRMAKKPENVYRLLEQVWVPALEMAKKERSEMELYMKEPQTGRQGVAPGGVAATPLQDTGKVEYDQFAGWDWRYYSEKVMKQQFDIDEETVKPFFELNNVRNGIFYVANRLYGITFSEVKDAPKYYPDVTLWECKDADGSHLGVLYLDFHPRASKRGGAWCGSYRPQSYKNGKRVAPVSTIVCNFTAPAGDKPALLTPDEVETFFHEFGHALNGLLRNIKYSGLSSIPRDFVELPSQIMEHWAFEPEVLKVYAKHYKTGKVIPSELVEKIEKSSKYGQGFKTTEYVAASILDMDYHTLKEVGTLDVLAFEKASMDRIGLIPQIAPRYRSTYFQHSMTGGYTAGYYSYIWAEVLDADAFQAFKEKGDIFDKETSTKFRKCILERGGSKDAMQMYIDFRGKEPTIDALLENRGLK
jgi:peptidyl-dipeptidase Dcp